MARWRSSPIGDGAMQQRLRQMAAESRQRQRDRAVSSPETTGAPEATGPEQRRVCIDCRYDLSGIDWSPAACPECGREFDPSDPTTTRDPLKKGPLRTFVNRYGIPIVIGALLLTGFRTTVLPRPADLRDWRLWTWLGELYGVERVPGSAFRGWGRPFQMAPDGRVYWWGERPWRIVATGPRGATLWHIQRTSGRDWQLEVETAGVRYDQVIAAFSAIKPEMFGVQYTRQTNAVFDEPATITGSTVDLFERLVAGAGLELQPFIFREGQTYVWMFDPSRGKLYTLSLEEAAEKDVAINRDRSNRFVDRPLVPDPAG